MDFNIYSILFFVFFFVSLCLSLSLAFFLLSLFCHPLICDYSSDWGSPFFFPQCFVCVSRSPPQSLRISLSHTLHARRRTQQGQPIVLDELHLGSTRINRPQLPEFLLSYFLSFFLSLFLVSTQFSSLIFYFLFIGCLFSLQQAIIRLEFNVPVNDFPSCVVVVCLSHFISLSIKDTGPSFDSRQPVTNQFPEFNCAV